MRKTDNYGLALYDKDDKMNITAEENSLNANMKIIDSTLKEKATINDMTNYIEEHKEELKGADGKDGTNGQDGKDGENGKDGYTPIKGVDYFDGKDGSNGIDGKDGKDGINGQDGYSPIAKIETTSTGATITITDKNGTTTTNITNGKDGAKGDKGDTGETGAKGDKGDKGDTGEQGIQGVAGKDGVSVTHSWNGTTLTVTSASGTTSANLKGEKGDTGEQGVQGAKGETGATGEKGDKGDKGDKGSKGADGYTPVKGTDYWTEDDKTEIKEYVQECVDQSGSGVEVEYVQRTFKVWGPNATSAVEGDIVTTLNSGYYDKTGKQVETGTFGCTVPFIEISEDATIYAYNLYQFEAGYSIMFLDASKNVISGVGGVSSSNRLNGNITIPNGTKYVGITLLKSDPGMYAQITTTETIVKDKYNEEITYDYEYLSSHQVTGYYDTKGVFQSTTSFRCTDYISVSEGDTLDLKLTSYNTASAIAYFDKDYKFVGNIVGETWSWSTSVYPLTGTYKVPEGAYFMRVSIFVADYATEQYITLNRSTYQGMRQDIEILKGKPLNILILGDSYSDMGYWVEAMKEVIEINNIINLGVSSATVRDRYDDRTTYPYSDRPDLSDGSGNTNTLSCQIQKLKRLMLGQDLDANESQIYTNETEYPDVIIIEGGMNDGPDSDEVVGTYYNQFLIGKTAYYKQNSSSSVTQTTVYVKPSLDEIDRTCFAGAYRYLCEELITLFPNAQIFLTTASHMNYFTVDPNVRYGKIAEQQRKCADIMSYTIIDWHKEGNLNTMMIELNGIGTEINPYTPVGGNEYTTDLLHPNSEGGKRYGRLAGKVIKQKFLGIS